LSFYEELLPDSSITMRDCLLGSSWARDLTENQLARVERETQIVRHSAGSIVCHQGAPAQHWIGVLDGMVKVTTVSRDGRPTTFIGVSSGGWLGEGSLLKREPRFYEVVTLRDSWIAFMPLETFDWLFETSLSFNHFLVRQLNARLGQFVGVVESFRIQSSTAQLAVCIAELVNPALCSSSSDVLRISQGEIARLCGLSRQVVNRALHELEGAGLVRVQYGSIHLLDIDGLHAFGRGLEPKN
jgi:CRP/FNR family cyclic AMP-dependent transcriptional regulator